MLNDMTNGIALHIPHVYIQRMVGASIIVYIGSRLYMHRKSLLNMNEPIPACMCEFCLDALCEKVDLFD